MHELKIDRMKEPDDATIRVGEFNASLQQMIEKLNKKQQ